MTVNLPPPMYNENEEFPKNCVGRSTCRDARWSLDPL
nr:MAG TPA: hypothetical protein [Herelleviridae sp.]